MYPNRTIANLNHNLITRGARNCSSIAVGAIGAMTMLLLAGCVTNIAPTSDTNPPPTEALGGFQNYEVSRISLADGQNTNSNEVALVKVQENWDKNVDQMLSEWAESGSNGRTLLIEPVVTEMKFVSGGKRVFLGAAGGSSAVLMSVTLTDKETGAVIAQPQFFQRAAAYGGAWTFGGTDNAMLARISTLVSQYLSDNKDEAVGGSANLVRTE